MTPEEFLVEKRIIDSINLDTRFNLNLSRDTHIATTKKIIEAMQEYADLQNQELKKEIQLYSEELQHMTGRRDFYKAKYEALTN